MDEGLFPKRAAGWFILVVLAGLYYVAYYRFLYPELYRELTVQYTRGTSYSSTDICSVASNSPDLKIYTDLPKNISEFAERNLLVTIDNPTDSTVHNVGVTLTSAVSPYTAYKVKISTARTNLLGSSLDDGSYLSDSILIEEIPARSSKRIVFWLYLSKLANPAGTQTSENTRIDLKLACFVGEATESQQKELIKLPGIEYNSSSAFQDSFTSVALLPPWSNGVLFILALAVVKLVEENIPHITDEDGEFTHNGDLGRKTFLLFSLITGYSLIVYSVFLSLGSLGENWIDTIQNAQEPASFLIPSYLKEGTLPISFETEIQAQDIDFLKEVIDFITRYSFRLGIGLVGIPTLWTWKKWNDWKQTQSKTQGWDEKTNATNDPSKNSTGAEPSTKRPLSLRKFLLRVFQRARSIRPPSPAKKGPLVDTSVSKLPSPSPPDPEPTPEPKQEDEHELDKVAPESENGHPASNPSVGPTPDGTPPEVSAEADSTVPATAPSQIQPSPPPLESKDSSETSPPTPAHSSPEPDQLFPIAGEVPNPSATLPTLPDNHTEEKTKNSSLLQTRIPISETTPPPLLAQNTLSAEAKTLPDPPPDLPAQSAAPKRKRSKRNPTLAQKPENDCIFCNNCGTSNSPFYKFCSECGSQLKKIS